MCTYGSSLLVGGVIFKNLSRGWCWQNAENGKSSKQTRQKARTRESAASSRLKRAPPNCTARCADTHISSGTSRIGLGGVDKSLTRRRPGDLEHDTTVKCQPADPTLKFPQPAASLCARLGSGTKGCCRFRNKQQQCLLRQTSAMMLIVHR